ncbi:MAG: hypothetical protein ABI663_17685 [Chryseolinea sp.]
MKKILLMVIVIMIAFSCRQKEAAKGSGDNDSVKLSTDETERLLIGNIDLTEASQLISNFVGDTNQNEFLRTLSQNRALGGIFSIKNFPKCSLNSNEAVVLWFCINNDPSDLKSPPFFLSAEMIPDLSIYPNGSYPKEPVSIDSLEFPKTFTYDPDDGASTKDVRKFLIEHTMKTKNLKKIHRDKVNAYKSGFQSLQDQIPHPGGGQYCKYPLAIFQNSEIEVKTTGKKYSFGVHAFLDQKPTYIRYYFGYNKDEPENRIRVILFAVNAKGENIIEQGRGEPAIILQKSVPPFQ